MFGIARHSFKEAQKAQIVVPESEKSDEKPMTSLYAGNADLFDPYLSPVFGDYKDFPKIPQEIDDKEDMLIFILIHIHL